MLFLLGVAALVAVAVFKIGWVSRSGLVGLGFVLVVSTAAFGLGGLLYAFAVLAASSFVTRFRYEQKVTIGAEEPSKGARDIWRILGGAGAAGVISVLWLVGPLEGNSLLPIAFVASIAVTSADTWASELGALSPGRPRLILSPRIEVSAGTSGGISAFGEVAALAGSSFAAVVVILTGILGMDYVTKLAIVVLAGILAEHVDSILGASLQGVFFCRRCQVRTERRKHSCGNEAELVRGLAFLSNERVNFVSTIVGALIAVLLGLVLI